MEYRGRFQHVGFNRMAPPGAGNTKPCDYPKHTGSAWVPEPAAFPSLQLWRRGTHVHAAVLPSRQQPLPFRSQKQIASHHLDLDLARFPLCSLLLNEKATSPGRRTRNNKRPGKRKKTCGLEFKHDFLSRLRPHSREASRKELDWDNPTLAHWEVTIFTHF